MKKAFIIGVTGQDGAYLSEFLLKKGYEVHGSKRRSSSFNTSRIDHISNDPELKENFHLHYGDLTDSSSLIRTISEIQPDEIYNLGAMSHVRVSFDIPEYVAEVDGVGTLRVLEAIRTCGLEKKTRFYQASTSELYGKVQEIPQTEKTPFYPRSPYGVAKMYSYWITVNYREAYGIFASNGILFNHESPLRGGTFVIKKITQAVASIKHGQQDCLYLGNLDSKRDWGYAPDFVEGMWKILQHDQADDFVLATGETHTVRSFVENSFISAGIEIKWKGEAGTVNEIGVNKATGKEIVKVDPRYFRPTEVDILIGNPAKAKEKLNWEPKVKFSELVKIMVEADLKEVERSLRFN